MRKSKKELFLVDTGVLWNKNDKDYDDFYEVYDKEYGYYDENQFYTYDLETEIEIAREIVESKPANFYTVIVSQGLSEIPEKKIRNGNYDITGANYNVNDIVWSIKTDENGNVTENFVKGQKAKNNG